VNAEGISNAAGRATIRDVAGEAGVSIGTVSRVLGGTVKVRPKHVAAVQEAIARLGYEPRPPGAPRGPRGPRRRPNARRRTFRIAFLSPGIYGSLAHVPVYLDVLHGVQAAAEENGLNVVLGTDSPETQRDKGELRARVDGAIYLGFPDYRQVAKLVRRTPCVRAMGMELSPDDAHDHVTYDNAAIGALAADHLLGRGCRRCAVLGEPSIPNMGERLRACTATLQAVDAPPLMLDADGIMTIRGGANVVDMDRLAEQVDRLLSQRPAATGLFVASDHWLGPVYALLYQRGIQPGRDITLIGCNRELPLLNALHPRPATIDIHAEEVGRRAVKQLMRRMADPGIPPAHIAIPPAVVPGEEGRVISDR
jgi:DNA-binding LacI/PurR family transcriptional regulator